MSAWRNKALDFSVAFLLVLCTLVFFVNVLLSDESLYGGDFVLYFHPLKQFIRDEMVRAVTLPLWNIYQFSGAPLITNIQASLFYPLGFLYYLMTPDIAYVYSTIFHCIIGSILMFLLMRSMSVSPVGSFFGAIVFAFNGYFMGHLYAGHLSFMQNYIWIPVIFLFLHRFTLSKRLPAATAAGLILGLQILGGFPQIAFYTLFASTLFILYKAVTGWSRQSVRDIVKLGSGLILFLFLGFCLAAVQVLPTLEFSRLSTRAGGINYAMATYESLHPKEILAFLVPDLYGNPVDQTYWRSRGFWHFWESCGYVGILPLFLLFVKGDRAEKKGERGFFVFLAFLAVFLALGKYNPLYPLIYRMPGFNSFRIPAQILFLYVFSVAVLSAIGLGKIADGEWSFRRGYTLFAWLTGGVLFLAVLSLHLFPFHFYSFLFRNFAEGPVNHADLSLLSARIIASLDRTVLFFFLSLFLLWAVKARRLRVSLFGVLACTIVFLDLYLFGAPLVKTHKFVTPDEKRRLLDQLPSSPVEGRVVTTDPMFRTNDGLEYGFPSILGYDPLILKRYADFCLFSQDLPADHHVVNLSGITNPRAKLLRLLHVRKWVSEGRVINLENTVPYAFFVEEAVVKKENEVLTYLQSDPFDPVKVVVLEEGESGTGNISKKGKGEALESSCEVISYSLERIILKTSSNRPGYLVVSEVFYPGWRASVDGQGVEIYRGNYLFRVIPLDAGEHEVRMSFVSWPLRIGAVISLVALTLSLCFLVIRKGS